MRGPPEGKAEKGRDDEVNTRTYESLNRQVDAKLNEKLGSETKPEEKKQVRQKSYLYSPSEISTVSNCLNGNSSSNSGLSGSSAASPHSDFGSSGLCSQLYNSRDKFMDTNIQCEPLDVDFDGEVTSIPRHSDTPPDSSASSSYKESEGEPDLLRNLAAAVRDTSAVSSGANEEPEDEVTPRTSDPPKPDAMLEKRQSLEIIQENNSELSGSNSAQSGKGRNGRQPVEVTKDEFSEESPSSVTKREKESKFTLDMDDLLGNITSTKSNLEGRRTEEVPMLMRRKEKEENPLASMCNPLSTNNASMKGTKTTQALSHSYQTTVEYTINSTVDPRRLSDQFHFGMAAMRYTNQGKAPTIRLNKRLDPSYIFQLAYECAGDDRITLPESGILFGAGLINNYYYAVQQLTSAFSRSRTRNKLLLRSASSSMVGLSASRIMRTPFLTSAEQSHKGLLRIKRKNIIPVEGVESQVVVHKKSGVLSPGSQHIPAAMLLPTAHVI